MSPIKNDAPKESEDCLNCRFCIAHDNQSGFIALVCDKDQDMSLPKCPLFRKD